jgi:hypothetical protein
MRYRAMRAVNTNLKLYNLKQLRWPVTGCVLGILVGIYPSKTGITLQAGMAAWCAEIVLVALLSAHPMGTRVGALVAGVFIAVPCYVWASPLTCCLLVCGMALPLLGATALLLAPPITGFGARLAYVWTCFPRGRVERRARSFDWAALQQLIVATVVLAVAIAAVKAIPAFGLWLPLRWLAVGIMVLAFGEMATACPPFLTAPLGVTVPPLMQSPYLSTSISEFWAERWNVQASALFHRFCFAPLARRSIALGVCAAFGLSAVWHACLAELGSGRWRISLVFGAFFIVQPLLIAAERRMKARRWPPAAGRAWTLTALAITSPLIIEPTLQIIEGSWGPLGNVLGTTAVVLGSVVVFSGIIALAAIKSPSVVVAELAH